MSRCRPSQPADRCIVDSTGLSIVDEGEWAAAKHGGRGTRGWKKLHLGVDRSGVIVTQALTEATVDDAAAGIDLVGVVAGDAASVTGDAAYDTVAFYEAARARDARVVVPPTRTAKVSRRGPRSSARDRAIADVETLGRRQWKKASGYHSMTELGRPRVVCHQCVTGLEFGAFRVQLRAMQRRAETSLLYFRSCTTVPPTSVSTLNVVGNASGGALKMSWDRIARSASIPGESVPFCVSIISARAEPRV